MAISKLKLATSPLSHEPVPKNQFLSINIPVYLSASYLPVCICPFIYPYINTYLQSTLPPIHPSIHPEIHPSTHPSFYPRDPSFPPPLATHIMLSLLLQKCQLVKTEILRYWAQCAFEGTTRKGLPDHLSQYECSFL